MNFKNYIHLIQFILETKVILKKIPHKIVQYFTQCTNILKRLLVCVVVIMLIFGNLKDSLMKILQLLLHPIIILTPSYFGTKTRVELNWSCMFLSCHVRIWEWIHTLQLPECQGTPCSKQAQNLKVKWLQLNSNPEPLSS